VFCSDEASALGVKPLMPLAEVHSLLDPRDARRLIVVEDDPMADREAFEQLAHWCQRYTPLVSIEETERPECLFLDVTGCLRLFRGEGNLCSRAGKELHDAGYEPRLALAEAPGAAWALARFAAQERPLVLPADRVRDVLRSLPIEALRIPDDVLFLLRELGVTRIDQLEALPAADVVSRIGRDVVERLGQAMGSSPELTIPHRPIPVIEADERFEYPIDQCESVMFVLERFAQRIASALPPHRGLQQLYCQLFQEAAPPIDLTIDLTRPSASPRRWLELLRLRLESTTLAAPVEGICLRAVAMGPLEYRQGMMFEAEGADAESQLGDLIERLGSRLGRDAVLVPRPVADAQPEYAFRLVSCFDRTQGRIDQASHRVPKKKARQSSSKPAPFAAFPPGARPTLLLGRPIPIRVASIHPEGGPLCFEIPPQLIRKRGLEREHRVHRAWGPERIETGWWRKGLIRRDYFRVETTEGRRFWLFRHPGGQWYLHGFFD
jgi:protein ImuB